MGSSDGPATRRESSRNVQSQYASKPGFAAVANGKRQRVSTSAEPDDGVANGPNTPATTNSGGTPNKPTRGDSSGSEGVGAGPANKKQRAAWNAEAIALGYEAGTIKNSAYVLLAQSGAAGMTVAAIVDAATKQGLYSWGTCKTPNNSVTAALSQDTTFVRIAPSTYALRSTLKGAAGPVPQPRTSSGSINSGHVGRSNSGSGLSAGAVAGARSNLGQNAISSKARKVERQRVEQAALERRGGSVADSLGAGMAATEATAYGYPAMHGGMFSGGIAGQAMGAGGGMNGLAGNASKISSTLAMESYRRRMDVCGGAVEGEWDQDRVFQCIPAPRPEMDMSAATAGSCLFWYPTANPPAPPADKPSPLKEPTEALIRASSWKDEAKSLFGSPNVKDFEEMTGLTRIGSGHLPKWVLESFNDGKSSPGAIAA